GAARGVLREARRPGARDRAVSGKRRSFMPRFILVSFLLVGCLAAPPARSTWPGPLEPAPAGFSVQAYRLDALPREASRPPVARSASSTERAKGEVDPASTGGAIAGGAATIATGNPLV